jgi:hypothetical protein
VRILQCWWVLFTLVPFGWLAFVAFVYAAIRARRGAWFAFAALYFVSIWGATVVGSIDQLSEGAHQAAGLVLILAWPASFIHALALTPRYLRARAERIAAARLAPGVPVPVHPQSIPPPPVGPVSMPVAHAAVPGMAAARRDPIEVPGWSQGWAGGRVLFAFFAFFTAALILGGLLFLFSDVSVALVMLLFGLGSACTLPSFITWRRNGAVSSAAIPDRPGRIGLYFPYSRGKHRATVFGLLLMSFACAAFAWASPDIETRLAGIIGFAVLGMNAVRILAKPGAPPYVALIEEGIVARVGASASFVPWGAVIGIVPVEIRMRSAREQFVGVNVSDRTHVETSGWGRTLMRINRWVAADLSYTTRGLDVDPALLFYAAHFYWRRPELRQELSSASAVDRVTGFDLFGDSPTPGTGTSEG